MPLISSFRAIRLRFRNRLDSEHEQALVRLVIAVLILAYLSGLHWFDSGSAGGVGPMMLVMLTESLIGLGLVASILIRPEISAIRRWVGMLADYGTLTALMVLSPIELAPLYVIILWVTIGNGLRYGGTYLASATGLAVVAFCVVIIEGPSWRAQPFLSAGLLIGLVAIPWYMSSLMRALGQAIDAGPVQTARSSSGDAFPRCFSAASTTSPGTLTSRSRRERSRCVRASAARLSCGVTTVVGTTLPRLR